MIADVAKTREQAVARLLANREIDEDGCWLWTKSCRHFGYGQTSYADCRNVAVHRLAAHLWLGFDLASPLCVLHECDKPRCFNPACLFIGTKADNTADMLRKGRNRFEVRRKSPEVVAAALALVESGHSQREAARRVGVSHSAVQDWLHAHAGCQSISIRAPV